VSRSAPSFATRPHHLFPSSLSLCLARYFVPPQHLLRSSSRRFAEFLSETALLLRFPSLPLLCHLSPVVGLPWCQVPPLDEACLASLFVSSPFRFDSLPSAFSFSSIDPCCDLSSSSGVTSPPPCRVRLTIKPSLRSSSRRDVPVSLVRHSSASTRVACLHAIDRPLPSATTPRFGPFCPERLSSCTPFIFLMWATRSTRGYSLSWPSVRAFLGICLRFLPSYCSSCAVPESLEFSPRPEGDVACSSALTTFLLRPSRQPSLIPLGRWLFFRTAPTRRSFLA